MSEGYNYNKEGGLKDEMSKKLLDIAEEVSFALPKYKAENFVGGAQITPYAKLKQWLLELRGREDIVEHLEYTVRKQELEIQIQEESKEFITDPKRKELVDLTVADMKIDLRKFQRNLKDAHIERQGFIDLIKEFLDTDDAKLPDGGNLIDVVGNKELEHKYEHEYWTVRMAKQAMLDMVSYGRIGTGNLDSILMMSPDQRENLQVVQVLLSSKEEPIPSFEHPFHGFQSCVRFCLFLFQSFTPPSRVLRTLQVAHQVFLR